VVRAVTVASGPPDVWAAPIGPDLGTDVCVPRPPLSQHGQFVTWSAVVRSRAFGRLESPSAVVAELVDALA
jgi:hypothetical protein